MNGAQPLVLASASPRRRRLIGWLGVSATCVAADIPEDISVPLAPDMLAMSLAAEKARVAATGLRTAVAGGGQGQGSGGQSTDLDQGEGSGPARTLVLAFDTIVVNDGRVLGKPADEIEAWKMLEALSGGVHEVVTGVAVLGTGGARGAARSTEEPVTFAVTTPVLMRPLDEPTVSAWIARGEYLGCAGAYNIEHHLASVADDQCFQNVAGLPLCHVYRALASGAGGAIPEGLTSPIAQCNAVLGRVCTLGPRVCG